ncbi:MAG: diacylglycerol kinase family lipid kinase [Acidobacteria bacterium]|nr:diacylglycerol kinase family lipid kinase [Acidobacteriota bacterium]
MAGKLRKGGERLIAGVRDLLSQAGLEVSPQPTPGPGTAGHLARQAIDSGAGLILALGGDGTINEVAEGMIGSPVPLGILPGGTANVLANELGLGNKIEQAAAMLRDCQPRPIFPGRIRDASGRTRHFLLMAGIGLDAHIVYEMDAAFKKKWGKLAYWLGGFSQLMRRLDEFHVTVDGHTRRCSFALLTKVRNYGGDLEIARCVTLLDDTFEVVLFEGRESVRYLKYMTAAAVNRLYGLKGVTILRARSASFAATGSVRVYMQVDGEYAGLLPGEVEMGADALTLLAPPSYGRSPKH